ncbi:cytochrome P450 [Xylaria bambusicola]|uniref:cytochrome P450 n=1 Tax=Xylaria bambusicola TaxID=326684 RepID=UPI002008064E|nr:cytochrome P450 [Xylaria bambusicola]KAI0521079.1 cytochrome P450 [Xylaria bambusicola]
MGAAVQILSLPSLTLIATIESSVVIKFYVESFSRFFNLNAHLQIVAVIFLVNYAFAALFWGFIYPRFLSPLRRLKGPRNFISLAHRTLIEKDRPGGDLFLELVKQYPNEEILNLTAFDYQVVVTSPRLLPDLLVHRPYDFIKPPKLSGLLRHVLGDGLIMVEGDQHKFLRKNSMPAFGRRHIKDLYPMMWNKSVLMCEVLDEALETGEGKNTGVVDLANWTSRVTLDIIGVAGMGREFNMLKKAEDPILGIYEQLLEPAAEKLLFAMTSIVFGLNFVRLLPWKMNSLFRTLTTTLSDFCMPMIHEKKDAILKSKDDHFDILSLLIKSGNFTDPQLRDQLLTFLAAGHETTSSALSWACYLLSKHQDMQEKLREEIRQALPEHMEIDKTTDLAGILEPLPILNGIMNETLRLYPTVPLTLRQAARDTNLGTQAIPEGVTVVLSMWQMNRSPELWGPDAGEFRPERWITAGKPNSNGGADSNYEFTTFLHGPRSCIGQNFAKAEMRCLLASMIRTFSWDLAMDESKILPKGAITIKPNNGLLLKLKPLYA